MKTQNFPLCADEMLSALVDGELDAAQCAQAVLDQAGNRAVAEQWQTYHLIGQALRLNSSQSELAITDQSADAAYQSRFTQRLSQRLLLEKVAPAETPLRVAAGQVTVLTGYNTQPAANDANVRWKMLAGVACMGLVAALAWSASGFNAGNSGQLAQIAADAMQGRVVVASPQGPMVRDTRLEELLAAHKQMGGTSLPVPTGFLRNANFENQPGARN